MRAWVPAVLVSGPLDAAEVRPSCKEERQEVATGTIEQGCESGRDAAATESRGKPKAKVRARKPVRLAPRRAVSDDQALLKKVWWRWIYCSNCIARLDKFPTEPFENGLADSFRFSGPRKVAWHVASGFVAYL